MLGSKHPASRPAITAYPFCGTRHHMPRLFGILGIFFVSAGFRLRFPVLGLRKLRHRVLGRSDLFRAAQGGVFGFFQGIWLRRTKGLAVSLNPNVSIPRNPETFNSTLSQTGRAGRRSRPWASELSPSLVSLKIMPYCSCDASYNHSIVHSTAKLSSQFWGLFGFC